MKEDIASISILTIFAILFILALIGASHLIIDFRDFKEITEDCKKRGYIQNDKARINCTVIAE